MSAINREPYQKNQLTQDELEELFEGYIITIADTAFKRLAWNQCSYFVTDKQAEKTVKHDFAFDAVIAYNSL